MTKESLFILILYWILLFSYTFYTFPLIIYCCTSIIIHYHIIITHSFRFNQKWYVYFIHFQLNINISKYLRTFYFILKFFLCYWSWNSNTYIIIRFSTRWILVTWCLHSWFRCFNIHFRIVLWQSWVNWLLFLYSLPVHLQYN